MKKFTAILLAVFTVIVLPLNVLAWSCDEKQLFLEFNNAPQGTLYVDLLVQMDNSDEHWSDFTQQPQRTTGSGDTAFEDIAIGADSEIAKYDVDGFVSFSMHSSHCQELTFVDDKVYMYLDCEAQTVFDSYTIKAAYVDESGRVLDVTDIALSDKAEETPFTLRANGHNATLISAGISNDVPEEAKKTASRLALIITIAITLALLAIVLLVIYVIKKISGRVGKPRR